MKNLKATCFFLGALFGFQGSSKAVTTALPVREESAAEKDARMKWWREARFGLFIHWGIYSVPAGTWRDKQIPGLGEWIMSLAKIPVGEYATYAERFNPVKFDADAWVRLAKEAGMKYIVITSKHHDGFAMFRSAVSSFNVYDATPFNKDPLKELAAACQKYDIKLGLYYSQAQDWHHRGGGTSNVHWDPAAQDGSMEDYIREIAVPQVKEILTNYGPIAILWWDTPHHMTPELAAQFVPLLKLQPGIITNNRLGGGYRGDTETPEQNVPATGYPRDWEACMTMNDTWGFKSYDNNWKSSESLIRSLIDIVSKGGNYLLNVGPSSEGLIPEPSVERLQDIGAWLKKNGEAIYATTASPFKRLDWGRATQKRDTLYLFVFEWPANGVLTVPMSSSAKAAHLLAAPEKPIAFTVSPNGLRLQLPVKPTYSLPSVIVLEGVGRVNPLPPAPFRVGADGAFSLGCDEAELVGPGLRIEGNAQFNLTDWNSTSSSARWQIQVDRPGEYEVSVLAQVPAYEAGSEFVVMVGDKTLAGQTKATKGLIFQETVVGRITLATSESTPVMIRPSRVTGAQLMKLRTLLLRPITKSDAQAK